MSFKEKVYGWNDEGMTDGRWTKTYHITMAHLEPLTQVRKKIPEQFQYLTFQPNLEVSGVCKVKGFASMLVYTYFPFRI